jgi:hypothetical protein
MAMQADGYYYNQQLKKYVLQFMAIFSGLQVQVGKSTTLEERLITVPIHYATTDRVVAAIMGSNTQNKPLRLPMLSAYKKNLTLDMSRAKGTGGERRNAYTPVGGLVPDDTRVVYQRMPVPYKLEMELAMYCSNTDQEFQILEQILPLFDPSLVIQTSDAPLDWTRMTQVDLVGMSNDNNYPVGTDRRIIQKTFNFEIPIWIDIPSDVRRNLVEKVFLRIGTVSTSSDTSEEIVADLDGQGIEYELIHDASALDI